MTIYGYGQIVNKPFYCSVYRNANQTLDTGTREYVDYDTLLSEDPDDFFDMASSPVTATIPYSGNWIITANVGVNITAVGILYLGININDGSGYKEWGCNSVEGSGANTLRLNVSVSKYIEKESTVQVWVEQYTGFNATLLAYNYYTNCHIVSSIVR